MSFVSNKNTEEDLKIISTFPTGRAIDIKMLGVSQCHSELGHNDIIVSKIQQTLVEFK